jgi:hypothetical protein
LSDPGQVGLPNEAALRILNKSWTLTANIEVPEAGAEGMIVTHGGVCNPAHANRRQEQCHAHDGRSLRLAAEDSPWSRII